MPRISQISLSSHHVHQRPAALNFHTHLVESFKKLSFFFAQFPACICVRITEKKSSMGELLCADLN